MSHDTGLEFDLCEEIEFFLCSSSPPFTARADIRHRRGNFFNANGKRKRKSEEWQREIETHLNLKQNTELSCEFLRSKAVVGLQKMDHFQLTNFESL
jgi:hypothetical protein